MLSFIIPARSQPEETRLCLDSVLHAIRTHSLERLSEFILLDDDSDPSLGITPRLFQPFRAATSAKVSITRFSSRQHYTGVLAYGLARAQGDNVFFISNDMFMTPAWLSTILAVAAISPTYGVIRGTAEVVDSHPEHQYAPPFEAGNPMQWITFSNYMAEQFGLHHVEDSSAAHCSTASAASTPAFTPTSATSTSAFAPSGRASSSCAPRARGSAITARGTSAPRCSSRRCPRRSPRPSG